MQMADSSTTIFEAQKDVAAQIPSINPGENIRKCSYSGAGITRRRVGEVRQKIQQRYGGAVSVDEGLGRTWPQFRQRRTPTAPPSCMLMWNEYEPPPPYSPYDPNGGPVELFPTTNWSSFFSRLFRLRSLLSCTATNHNWFSWTGEGVFSDLDLVHQVRSWKFSKYRENNLVSVCFFLNNFFTQAMFYLYGIFLQYYWIFFEFQWTKLICIFTFHWWLFSTRYFLGQIWLVICIFDIFVCFLCARINRFLVQSIFKKKKNFSTLEMKEINSFYAFFLHWH